MDRLEEIVDRIDEGELEVSGGSVARRLVEVFEVLSPAETEAMRLYDAGTWEGREHLRSSFFDEEDRNEAYRPRGRLFVFMLGEASPLQGHEAGFLMSFARQAGLSEETIVQAFDQSHE